jgi:two-component system, sensor histidine kinase
MKILPRFREERVLREQVALMYRNYVVGTFGYLICAILVTLVIHFETAAPGIYYWFAAAVIVTACNLSRYWIVKDKTSNPGKEAVALVWSKFFASLIWGILPLVFMTSKNTAEMVSIAVMTTGVMAGGLITQSACLPVSLTYILACVPALALSFFLLDDPIYIALGIGTLVYLSVLIVFAFNVESMIKQSIELRFKNLNLIEQLRVAMAETETANHAKSVFLASASHDLRQPLHAMGLFIETLTGTKLDAYQQGVIEHIESASHATREMLNTLLDFSKLDAGVIKPRPHAFRLQNLFNKLERELGASADSKKLIYRTRETGAVAYADVNLVELILRNLITNAIRYSEQGGVLIACRYRADKTLIVEVWDTGIGIAETDQQAIFREFHQLGNPERDRQKGFGLGLAIAKGLATTMGLELCVRSRPGKGSVFRLLLPKAETSVVADLAESQQVLRFDGKKILIIDDDEGVRLAMRELLLTWNCDCLIAESADEALTLVNGKPLDLIISDYRLREERTGSEAIALIRQQFDTDLPAIIITGDTAADRLREAQASDALLLHKPVATTELQRAMSSLLIN